MNCTFVVALVAVISLSLNQGWAQSQLVTWDVSSINAASTPIFGGAVVSHIDSANLTLGSGVTASTAVDTFGGSNFNQANLASALTDNDYLSFTISPATGYSLSLSSISYLVGKASSVTTFSAFLTSNKTGHTVDTILDTYTFSNAAPGIRSITLSNISLLQNLTSGVEFRLYGVSSSTDTFRVRSNAGADLIINGTLTTVPEPASTALVFGLVLFAGVWAKRRIAKTTADIKKPAIPRA